MAPTVEVFALLQFTLRDRFGRPFPITKHVRVIGIDPARQAATSQFGEYLVRQKHSPAPTFDLPPEAKARFDGNRLFADVNEALTCRGRRPTRPPPPKPGGFLADPPIVIPDVAGPPPAVPPPALPAAGPPRVPGVILGFSIAHYRMKNPETGPARGAAAAPPRRRRADRHRRGERDEAGVRDVRGGRLLPVRDERVRRQFRVRPAGRTPAAPRDGRAGERRPGPAQAGVRNDSAFVHDVLIPKMQALFPPGEAKVASWQQHQGPLLAAIDIERGILNLLLFMIVGVAGFSVLAIFTMIVGEKYRDIGILKSLGASNGGVMSIFLAYGLMLGLVGCALGTALGLAITAYINEIEVFLTQADRPADFRPERLLLRQNPDERGAGQRAAGERRGGRDGGAVQRPAGPPGGPAAPGPGAAVRVVRAG